MPKVERMLPATSHERSNTTSALPAVGSVYVARHPDTKQWLRGIVRGCRTRTCPPRIHFRFVANIDGSALVVAPGDCLVPWSAHDIGCQLDERTGLPLEAGVAAPPPPPTQIASSLATPAGDCPTSGGAIQGVGSDMPQQMSKQSMQCNKGDGMERCDDAQASAGKGKIMETQHPTSNVSSPRHVKRRFNQLGDKATKS